MPNTPKPRGGYRANAKRPKKYTTAIVKYSHWIPEPSKPLFDNLLKEQREKYLIIKNGSQPTAE